MPTMDTIHHEEVLYSWLFEHKPLIKSTVHTTVRFFKVISTSRAYAEPLTDAMVSFDLSSQKYFTSDIQAHYVYSPQLTRWIRCIYEAIRPFDILAVEGLVLIWAHEAACLFQDRLVTEEEKHWTDEHIDLAAMEHFPTINRDEVEPTNPLL